MSRNTLRRLVQLVAVLVCCFLVPAFAQSAQGGGSRPAKVQFSLRGHRPAAGHPPGGQSPAKPGNVRAKDGLGFCETSCDSKHGLCTCIYDGTPAGGECCALMCGDCHTDDEDN